MPEPAALFAAALRVAFADDQLEAHEQEALGGLVQALGLDPSQAAAAAQQVRSEQAAGSLTAPDPFERRRLARELRALVRRSVAAEATKQGALDGITRLLGPEPADEAPAPAGGGLRPLQCGACGAPVPLADSAHVECGGCGSEVPVPEQYRALRRSRGHLSLKQDEASAFLEILGHAPGRLGRGLAYAHVPVVVFPVVLAVFVVVTNFLVVGPIHAVARAAFATCAADTFSLRTKTLIWVGTFFVAVVLPYVLSRFMRIREVTRQGLLDGLAASPPTHPGGPARCRKCGAPLAVEAGALGVVCDYCGVENVIPRDAASFHEEHGAALFAADSIEAARMNYRDRTGTAWVKALGVAGLMAIVLAFVVLIVPEMAWNTFPGKWPEEVRHRNRHARAAWSGWDQWGDLRTGSGKGIYVPAERHPGSPMTRRVWLQYLLPLRAGETLRLHYSGQRMRDRKVLPAPEAVTLAVRFGELHGGAVQEGEAAPGAPAVFPTPVSGWFRLELRQGELEPGLDVWTEIEAP